MPLTEKELEQIREEAERLYPRFFYIEKEAYKDPTYKVSRAAHISAVTKERERANILLDGLNEIERIHGLYHKSEGNNPAANHLRNIAFEAMIKYNKK